jgi:hypothetical protein
LLPANAATNGIVYALAHSHRACHRHKGGGLPIGNQYLCKAAQLVSLRLNYIKMADSEVTSDASNEQFKKIVEQLNASDGKGVHSCTVVGLTVYTLELLHRGGYGVVRK